jgi:hypothetical protein
MEHGQDNNDVTLLCLKIRQLRPRFYLMIDDVAPENNGSEQIIVFIGLVTRPKGKVTRGQI